MSLHDEFSRLQRERDALQRALTDERARLQRTLDERPSLAAQLQALFRQRFPPLTITPDDVAGAPRTATPTAVLLQTTHVSATQSSALEQLAAEGEALFLALTARSATAEAQAESVLIIDLRGGWVEPFVAVPHFGGRIAAEPCFVQIDGGAAGPDSRSRAPLLACKPDDSSQWKAVSQAYFDELTAARAGATTSNALAMVAAAPTAPIHDRLFSAFLPRSITVDFDRVAFLVESQPQADWLRGFLTRMSSRLDVDGRSRWGDALILLVDAAHDMTPFACFTDLESAGGTDARVLVFDSPEKARMFDVRADGTAHSRPVSPAEATHVLLVGVPQRAQPGVLAFRDADALRLAGLIGFLQPQLRIDESRVATLREECARLQEQVDSLRSRSAAAALANQRAGRVLATV